MALGSSLAAFVLNIGSGLNQSMVILTIGIYGLSAPVLICRMHGKSRRKTVDCSECVTFCNVIKQQSAKNPNSVCAFAAKLAAEVTPKSIEHMTWLLLILLVGVTLALAWCWLQRARLLRENLAASDELKRMQTTQSQVMHTNKLASLGQMVAGVTHEINTPLGFLRSNAQVVTELLDEHMQVIGKVAAALHKFEQVDLAQPQAQEALRRLLPKMQAALNNDERIAESRELLSDALEGVDQISSLVKNLKGFARVDRDGQELWNVNEGIESALMIANHQLKDRIDVIKHLEAVPLVRVMPSQINQVFLNLITNAAQAMHERGTLTVSSRRNGESVEIEFIDTGSGIPSSVLPKIFDPFFTTKPVGEGTGLGLSIVHKILTSHQGDIKVHSTPGHGASFTVVLPVDHAALKSHSVTTRDPA
jgi:two-component system, NtrC family, sensor kinase